MSENLEQKVALLEKRLARIKRNMLSSVTRPRIIAGAVAMEEAKRNKEFAITLLAAFKRGDDRMVDRRTIEPFARELKEMWRI